MILSVRKGATAPFSCLPARMGSGKARNRVKGLVPCGFLGQRPKPSESFSESISTVFKVHLSLFFAAQFFINYLTLPLSFSIILCYPPCYCHHDDRGKQRDDHNGNPNRLKEGPGFQKSHCGRDKHNRHDFNQESGGFPYLV